MREELSAREAELQNAGLLSGILLLLACMLRDKSESSCVHMTAVYV